MIDIHNATKNGDNDGLATYAEEVTRELKLEFCAKVKKLSNKGLSSLVQKIKELRP